VTGHAFYVSAVTPIVLHLCILVCILKRTGERRKVKGRPRVISSGYKYYLWIGEKGFLFGENNFDLL